MKNVLVVIGLLLVIVFLTACQVGGGDPVVADTHGEELDGSPENLAAMIRESFALMDDIAAKNVAIWEMSSSRTPVPEDVDSARYMAVSSNELLRSKIWIVGFRLEEIDLLNAYLECYDAASEASTADDLALYQSLRDNFMERLEDWERQ